MIIRLAMLLAATATAAFFLLEHRLGQIGQSLLAARASTTNFEDGRLFGELVELRLARLVDGHLWYAPRDETLRELVEAGDNGAALVTDTRWQRRERALKALYETRNGAELLRQRLLYNRRGLIAVRDDRAADPAVHRLRPLAMAERRAGWMASDSRGRPVNADPLRVPFRGAKLPVRPGMSDWVAFAGEQPLLLLTTIAPRDRSTEIHVIGRLDRNRSVLSAGVDLGGINEEGGVIVLPPSVTPSTAVIALAPLPDTTRLPELRVAATSAGNLVWREPPPQGDPPAPFTIATADDVALWQEGGPTDAAAALGLLPLIGTATDRRGSLAWLLARRPHGDLPAILHLTIDAQAQEAAAGALTAGLDSFKASLRGPDPWASERRAVLVIMDESGTVIASAQHPRLPDGLNPYDIDRLLHGGPGELLTLALAWQAHLPDESAQTGSTIKPAVGYAGIAAVEGNPVIAAHIAGCPPTTDGRLNCLGLSLHQSTLRVAGQGGRGIKNFVKPSGAPETLYDAMQRPLRAAECQDEGPTMARVADLAIAMRSSNNLYFVRLAAALDHDVGLAYDLAARKRNVNHPNLPDLQDSRLLAAFQELGLIGEAIDLAGAGRVHIGSLAAIDILTMPPGRVALADLADSARANFRRAGAVDLTLQTAIGQSVVLPPIALARMMAGIAGGTLPVPRLLARWNDEPLAMPAGRMLTAHELGPLRRALKLVTETGTAKDMFNGQGPAAARARCATFGKTGTSSIPQAEDDQRPAPQSAWFTGWAEPQALRVLGQDNPSRWTSQRIFVTCFVSHTHGPQRTGGALCARMAGNAFARLAKAGQPQPAIPALVPDADE